MMFDTQRRFASGLALAALLTAGLACNLPTGAGNLTPTASGSGPVITINSPPSGSSGTVGTEFVVQSTSSDAVGVARVDLQVNGAVVRSDSTPDSAGQLQFAVLQGWTPSAPGSYTLTVIAYRADGTASGPASITVTITEAAAGGNDQPQACTVRANTDLNVRQGPSTAYAILRILPIGQQGAVTGHNGDRSWWQIDGSGWVSAPFVTSSGDCTGIQFASYPTPPPVTATPTATATTSGATPTSGTPTITGTPGTATPTTEVHTAAPDTDLNIEINIKNFTASYAGDVSYPTGDTKDVINITVVGFDSVLTAGDVTFTVTCAGAVSGADVSPGDCNQTFTQHYTTDSDTDKITIELKSGSNAYMTWILVISADN
jgi:hypothetical protein